jgi:apolipoprotein D and lipocalin family protein
MITVTAQKLGLLIFVVLQLLAIIWGSLYAHAAPTPVHDFKLPQYMGTWYEVARLPNLFQNDCAQNTIVQYRITTNGKIAVNNRCTKARGQIKQSNAVAWVPDLQKPGTWQFSFLQVFNQPVGAVPYWVLDFAPGRYAVVGQPGKQFGWVLARQPVLDKTDWLKIKQSLTRQGYNACQFKLYPQTAGRQNRTVSLCEVAS